MSVDLSLGYYDRILGGIAASLAAGFFLGLVGEWSITVGLFGGAIIATVFVYLGVFRNPPLPETSSTVKSAAVVWHAFLAVLFLAVYF